MSELFQSIEGLHKKAKEATSHKERRDISKEIGGNMWHISRLGGGIPEQSQGVATKPGSSGAGSTLLCTPPKALAQG